MYQRSLMLLSFVFLTSVLVEAKSVQCIDADKMPTVNVTGLVKKVLFQHPNGTFLTALMLQLDRPICYTQAKLDSAGFIALQDSEVQLTGKTQGLVDGARVSLTGQLSGNNISAYYLSDTAIELK